MKNSTYWKGAKNIIRRCLDLEPGQDLVIFFDEATLETVSLLMRVATELRVQPTAIFIPQEVQRLIPEHANLSGLAERMVQEVRAIITCVNGSASCMPFRSRLLEVNWSARTRVGHMPGASLEVLKLAAVDIDRLILNCRQIALALTRGQQLELESYGMDGSVHQLQVPLGGWDRIAVASDGIIRDGVWGNVPSGEAYIAPLENSASGSLVINGSLPDLVIAQGEELILSFEQGHLISIEPPDGPAAAFLEDTQFRKAKEKGDAEWSNLAEIGIGLNPAVDKLTGNMLFDEKMAGTAHVALGSNTFMGGRVKSTIHADMVTCSPTIRIDGQTILDHGRLSFAMSHWQENHLHIDLENSSWASADKVTWSGKLVQINSGLLQRCFYSEPGKTLPCNVGNEETAGLAGKLYESLPSDGTAISIEELLRTTRLPDETLRRVLHVMSLYELVHQE
jgi:leucyl aminopeptidase (aminopeptidase T)